MVQQYQQLLEKGSNQASENVLALSTSSDNYINRCSSLNVFLPRALTG